MFWRWKAYTFPHRSLFRNCRAREACDVYCILWTPWKLWMNVNNNKFFLHNESYSKCSGIELVLVGIFTKHWCTSTGLGINCNPLFWIEIVNLFINFYFEYYLLRRDCKFNRKEGITTAAQITTLTQCSIGIYDVFKKLCLVFDLHKIVDSLQWEKLPLQLK